jgi:dTDP-4-dehydrorhamnose 3,5-epimerase
MQVRDAGMGVLEIVPRKFGDARGFFAETWSRRRFGEAGIAMEWVQDNQSFSADKGVLRGLHFQVTPFAQDKLVRVLRGAIFDVAVDIRKGSPSFGRWVGCILSADAFNQLLIPKGFAHGFLTIEPASEVFYKVSAPYAPDCDRAIRWDDPAIAIDWPLDGCQPVLSDKDRKAPLLADIAASISF